MILLRLILISLIVYLLVRSIGRLFNGLQDQNHNQEPHQSRTKGKGVPKEVGEYVDYEEVE